MKYLVLIVFLLCLGTRTEAAQVPFVAECSSLSSHVDVSRCFAALNKNLTPDSTVCGQVDIVNIMQSLPQNNYTIGTVWRELGSLILQQCGYPQSAKTAFLELEKNMMGGPGPREKSEKSWRRAQCLQKSKPLSNEVMTADFISFLSWGRFGGGTKGDREAIKHIETLTAEGKTEELNKLMQQYINSRTNCPDAE